MIGKIVSWVFGIAVCANGFLNLFVGNDPEFGVGLLLLSLVYVPPVTTMLRKRFGFSIPPILKIVLGLLLIWVTLAVGALNEVYLQ